MWFSIVEIIFPYTPLGIQPKIQLKFTPNRGRLFHFPGGEEGNGYTSQVGPDLQSDQENKVFGRHRHGLVGWGIGASAFLQPLVGVCMVKNAWSQAMWASGCAETDS